MLNKYKIQEFIDACCQVLGIKSVPYSDRMTYGGGEFCTLTRTIMIDQDSLKTRGYDVYDTIAHECIHAKQFDDDRLMVDYDARIIVFDGEKYSQFKLGMMQYTDRPWEKEANGLMREVAMKACELLVSRKKAA